MTNHSLKPSSDRRVAANRRNALKSTGPKTPEGKARSAQNARRHGLSANNIVLSCEEKPVYLSMFRAFENYFRPSNEAERSILEELVAAKWQLRRAHRIYREQYERQMEAQFPQLTANWTDCTPETELAAAHSTLLHSGSILHLDRYQSRLSRDFNRNVKLLLELKSRPLKHEPIAQAPQPQAAAKQSA